MTIKNLHYSVSILGDFAVLLKAGMTVNQAIVYNLLSAMMAYVGMLIGTAVGQYANNITLWIFAITAGMFLYVALVDMVRLLSFCVTLFCMYKIRQCNLFFVLHKIKQTTCRQMSRQPFHTVLSLEKCSIVNYGGRNPRFGSVPLVWILI